MEKSSILTEKKNVKALNVRKHIRTINNNRSERYDRTCLYPKAAWRVFVN